MNNPLEYENPEIPLVETFECVNCGSTYKYEPLECTKCGTNNICIDCFELEHC